MCPNRATRYSIRGDVGEGDEARRLLIYAYRCGACLNLLGGMATHYEGDPNFISHCGNMVDSLWTVLLVEPLSTSYLIRTEAEGAA